MNTCSRPHPMPSTIELSPQDEDFLRSFILRRTGIVIQDYQLAKLRTKLNEFCLKFGYSTSDDFLKALNTSDTISPELENLISAITIGESYFFRDNQQFSWLRQIYLPELIRRRRISGNRSLRIWSAGSSEGQEIYSIAILLHELLPDIDDWHLHLLGTDINTPVLTSALNGQFREWSLRAMPDQLRAKYFRPTADRFEIFPEIRKQVKFCYLNLMEDSFPSIVSETNALDLILCRNVFIYLAQEVSREVMCKFASCLNQDGALLLGAADLVNWNGDELDLVQTDDIIFYRKGEPEPPIGVKTEFSGFRSEPTNSSHLAIKKKTSVSHRARVHPLSTNSQTRREKLIARKTGIRSQQQTKKETSSTRNSTILDLYRNGCWQELVNVVDAAMADNRGKSSLLGYKATALANLGKLDQATEVCEHCINENPGNKHIYLIQGLIRMERDQVDQAEASFRKALYLDRDCLESHYHLGLLLIRNGQSEMGLKSLKNALVLAEQGNSQQHIDNTRGMTYQRFAQILQQELSMFENQANG